MEPEPYSILRVPDDASEAFEQMGSKPKFWFRHKDWGLCLYKEARPGTGEDWAEKVAGHLCEMLKLPHALIELAEFRRTYGIVTPRFFSEGGTLVHGNELLREVDPSYPDDPGSTRKFCRTPQHTVDRVLEIVGLPGNLPPPGWKDVAGIETAQEVFVGYLMIDALIGNTDRHHEN